MQMEPPTIENARGRISLTVIFPWELLYSMRTSEPVPHGLSELDRRSTGGGT